MVPGIRPYGPSGFLGCAGYGISILYPAFPYPSHYHNQSSYHNQNHCHCSPYSNADNVRYVRLDQHIAVWNDTATQRCSALRGCALRCTALVLGPLSFDALLFHTLAQTHRGQFIDRPTGRLARRGAADLDIILVLKGLFHLMPQ